MPFLKKWSTLIPRLSSAESVQRRYYPLFRSERQDDERHRLKKLVEAAAPALRLSRMLPP